MKNTIIKGRAEEVLKNIKSNSIDMVMTSPPYDNLRSYNDCKWDFDIFKKVSDELFRVIKDGGVIVWIVSDATIKGSETGSSFKQALYFKKIGLRIHDTMIWNKNNTTYPSGIKSLRYSNVFEYMFILSKGRPKTTNLIMDKVNKSAGKMSAFNTTRISIKNNKDVVEYKYKKIKKINEFGVRYNIWDICSSNKKIKHPAMYPEKLVNDHIITWTNPGDVVLDCFAGSGTTLLVAKKLKRNYIGIELNEEYIDIINKRLSLYN
jgi:DNA modification methylase